MISYNNSDVVQCLRQYDMFANSLNLVRSREEKDMIIKQLTKLEEKIILLTNEIYEEEYYTLANKECALLEDEKNRITMLIELINQRLTYVEKRCNNHYQLTGESINVNTVLGASQLDNLENKVKIIDKYSKNIALEKELEEDIKSFTNKISLASEKIDINKSLNIELESTFKKTIKNAIEILGLNSLLDSKDDIEYAYYETEKSLTLAELNYESAKTSPLNILADCQKMLQEVSDDYAKYKDKMSTLKLMEIYEKEVNDYDELYTKRKEINEIIKSIKNEELLNLISDMISKQFSTILMEEQDINTLNDLVIEKERKLDALSEIKEENNSEEFQNVLETLIENEKKRQEKILEEQKKIEEEEKQKKLEIERKRQEEILKRQKIIEEARKKEIEKRTKQLLEEQQNSVLQNKNKEKKVSFENIKDNSLQEETKIEKQENIEQMSEVKEETVEEKQIDNIEESTFFKSKDDIEKELFEEFKKQEEPTSEPEKEENILEKIENKIADNQLPDMSIDEYMKNFDETKIENTNSLNDLEDVFPSIPM